MSEPQDRAGAVLTIDLDAIAANWRRLRDRLNGAECAGVVKADAYGLGAAQVAPALHRAGCRTFFVATIDEAIRLRPLVPDARVFVLNGVYPRTEDDFLAHELLPVLNTPEQVALWRAAAARRGHPLAAAVHVDTGMARLGLSPAEAEALGGDDALWRAVRPVLLLSHLACAEDGPGEAMNREQRQRFQAARALLPPMAASLANSSGIFLGADFHFDLARPGAALFGVNPTPGKPNPMAQVVHLQGKIVQVRHVDTPMTVGYGATHRIARRGRLATVAAGYADGYLRSLSNRATGVIGGRSVPMVGRVSMDLITFDISDVPERLAHPGAVIDLIGPDNPVDRIAAEAGTIGYEILTSLGRRYHRRYRGGSA